MKTLEKLFYGTFGLLVSVGMVLSIIFTALVMYILKYIKWIIVASIVIGGMMAYDSIITNGYNFTL